MKILSYLYRALYKIVWRFAAGSIYYQSTIQCSLVPTINVGLGLLYKTPIIKFVKWTNLVFKRNVMECP